MLNGTNKFRTAHAIGTRIADIMSRNGTTVFNQMLGRLKRFESIVTGGEAPFVSEFTVRADQLPDFSPLSQVLDDTAVPRTLIAIFMRE